jgi:hypothetical protein
MSTIDSVAEDKELEFLIREAISLNIETMLFVMMKSKQANVFNNQRRMDCCSVSLL